MDTQVVSSFFSTENKSSELFSTEKSQVPNKLLSQSQVNDITDDFIYIVDELNNSLEQLKLPSAISCIYNPTMYARIPFHMYVRKYCNTKKPIMYFGMNPGPWGMSQTGVPFGEISSVRDWLGIEGPVGKPPNEIAARPVKGFECTRTEVSGKRLWGLFKEVCGTPDNFFKSSFIYNYLPQQWMKSNGCNLTPGDFKQSEMEPLFSICDPAFIKVLELYEVEKVVAVGKFCEARAHKAIKKYLPASKIQIMYMPHPSPRTVNNNNWNEKGRQCLNDLNLLQYYIG